jgi:hypothetical protein
MRANRISPFLTVAVTVLVGFAVMLSSVLAGSPERSRPQSPVSSTSPSKPDEIHVLHGAFWRTDGGFVSTIRIKNILAVAPIQVSPTLFMADGTDYQLPPANVPISGVATLNINDALSAAPQSVAPHVSQFGSVSLAYTYPTPGHVAASVAAIDTSRSLSFVYQVMEPMPMPEDEGLQTLEGLWWKHDRGVTGSVSLTNVTEQARTATLRLVRQGEDSDPTQVQLPAHTTQVLNLADLARRAEDDQGDAGGVRVEYKGTQGAIMVTGSLANNSEGYSANMPFWSHNATDLNAKKINIGSAGIMVGKPDPMMMPGFPAETSFTPYLALRNTTAKPLDMIFQVNYMSGMDGTPVTRNLPVRRVHAFEAKVVELRSMLDAAGLKEFNGSLNFSISYMGHGADLVFATGSVDQTGTYVFEVAPQAIGGSIGKISGYWSVSGGSDAMFTVWNPTDAPQDIVATLYYGDGSGTYHLPVHLAPQASTMLDIAMLMMEETRDIEGKTIPSNIRDGSLSFASADTDSSRPDGKKRMTLVIAGGVFNVSTATCGEICQYCNGYSNFVLVSTPINTAVGANTPVSAQGTDSYGSNQLFSGGSWATSNSSIMAVNQGTVTGVSAGQVTIQNFLSNIDVWQGQFCVSDNMNDSCPLGNPSPYSPATAFSVQVTTADIVADQITVSMAPSTLNGTLTLTVNGPGISYSLFQGLEQGNTITFSFNRPQLPIGQYTYVQANWNIAGSGTATSTANDSFDVLGVYRHSQYNTPYESACTGSATTAWIITSGCTFTQTTLKSDFASQLFINGSGVSVANGTLHYYTSCSNYPTGANSQNSFLQVSTITGSCNTAPRGGIDVAVYPNPPVSSPTWQCGDLLEYVTSSDANQAQKSVQDYCPACNTGFNGTSGHIDDYSSSTACSGHSVGDYGNFLTIRLR